MKVSEIWASRMSDRTEWWEQVRFVNFIPFRYQISSTTMLTTEYQINASGWKKSILCELCPAKSINVAIW